jgi:hypothetical protein
MATIEESSCPACGAADTLQLDQALETQPIGSFSLAGAQMKFSARSRPRLTCSVCTLDLLGEYDQDGRHVTFDSPKEVTDDRSRGVRPL